MDKKSDAVLQIRPDQWMERCCRTPWDAYVKPFPMAPGVYYVSGNDWVACYLIDTGDGLILIDTAMHETCYLMLENIRALSYDPRQIRRILLTHAHADHVGAARTMKELTGAKMYIGERDRFILKERPDLLFSQGYTCGSFEADEVYEREEPIVQGNIIIHTIPTPGHTPGCTSMVFDVTGKDGTTYTCGLHGGVGLNTMSKEFLNEHGLPLSLQEEFCQSLRRLDEMHVDICLPSHTNQVDILSKVSQITENYNPFVDPEAWHVLMKGRLAQMEALMEQEKE